MELNLFSELMSVYQEYYLNSMDDLISPFIFYFFSILFFVMTSVCLSKFPFYIKLSDRSK